MTLRTIRLGVIGGGELSAIGRTHRLAQRLSERFELVAGAFDVDAQRGRRYGAQHGVAPERCYANVVDLIRGERERPDGAELVAVLTPNNTHYEIAHALVTSAFHVLCEKPMTVSVDDAERLRAEVRARKTVFGVMYGFSGYSIIERARELVQAGEIGQIRQIQSEFAFGLPGHLRESADGHWRTKQGIAGDSAVVGMIGTHLVYLARLITGLDIEEIAADFSTFVRGRELEDNANILIRYANGATGAMWNSYIAAGMDNGLKLRIYGEHGAVEWDHESPNHLKLYRPGEARQLITQAGPTSIAAAPEGFVEAFANVYRKVAAAVDATDSGHGVPRYPDVSDGVEGVRFVQAAVESSRRNASWVKLRTA